MSLDMVRLNAVLADVAAERQRQQAKWGTQDLPNGTGKQPDESGDGSRFGAYALLVQNRNARLVLAGTLTFEAVLSEEVAEALAESEPTKLRAELVQVAAVATQWIEALDRRAIRGDLLAVPPVAPKCRVCKGTGYVNYTRCLRDACDACNGTGLLQPHRATGEEHCPCGEADDSPLHLAEAT